VKRLLHTMPPLPSIAIVVTSYAPFIGGGETAAAQLATFLTRQGRRVMVVTQRFDRRHARREVLDGVDVFRVGFPGRRRALAKWLASPAFFRTLLRERGRFDVVVCIDYRAAGIAALLARAWNRRPVVFQAQTDGVIGGARVREALATAGLGDVRWLADLATWPIRRIYDGADAYCCISRLIERETLEAGVPRERVHYLPNPVDTALFRPAATAERLALRAKFGVDPEAVVAIFAGRLSREKGALDLIEAWCQGMPERAELIVVGPDMTGHPWDVGPAARARAASASRPVRFVGPQTQAALAEWLRLADVHVQPSHFEAFGTSAIEAMASGLPVIASDVGGLRDFVAPGVNGVRVPPKDPVALAGAMSLLLADTARRSALAAGALATAPAFAIDRVLGRYIEIIDRTVPLAADAVQSPRL
jgi:glycosyltransferase involved in cell wall biosynthesis